MCRVGYVGGVIGTTARVAEIPKPGIRVTGTVVFEVDGETITGNRGEVGVGSKGYTGIYCNDKIFPVYSYQNTITVNGGTNTNYIFAGRWCYP